MCNRLCLKFLSVLCAAALIAPVSALAQSSTSQAKEPTSGFVGLWQTSYGRMRLTGSVGKIRGHYALDGQSEVVGTVDADGRLKFRYVESAAKGEGWFELNKDGSQFHGQWRAEGTEKWRPWSGTRVEPVRNKNWLVILEANWETSLAEPPYSFGEMLQSFFSMEAARKVHVRHRFFHDQADFRRLCREVMYLAEPVVLLISSHGTKQGIAVNNQIIGPAFIAESVRGLSNLRLLHLSGCNMLEGDVAAKILAGLGSEPRFPISGYTTTVAWDTSAISDFLYLSLVLIRGLNPAEAVKQAHLLAPFTGVEPIPDGEFYSLGLKVLEPTATKNSPSGQH